MNNLNINHTGKVSTRRKRRPKVERFCESCGTKFKVWQSRVEIGKGRFCSTSCGKLGKNNPFWKGGRRGSNGYIYIYQPKHPNCTKRKYVKEHRLIVEKSIKRYLTKKEIVHHKNGIRDDNRLDNLELISNQSEHMKMHFDKKQRKWVKLP